MPITNPERVEDLLNYHTKSFDDFFDLISELKKSTELLLDKYNFTIKNERADRTIFYRLLGIVNREIANINYHFAEFINAQGEALLPITNQTIEEDDLLAIMSKIENCLSNNVQLHSSPFSRKFGNLWQVMLLQVTLLKENLLSRDEMVITTFDELLQRYKSDYSRDIAYYVEENISNPNAKAQLRKDFEGYRAVHCWNRNERDVLKTIVALRQEDAVETDLLPLFRYIAIYDALQESAPNPIKSEIHLHAQKVEVTEAGDIIAEGGVKNVNNQNNSQC